MRASSASRMRLRHEALRLSTLNAVEKMQHFMTMDVAFREIDNIISRISSKQEVETFISAVCFPNSNSPLLERKSIFKVLSHLCVAKKAKLAPFLPKIVSYLLRRMFDKDISEGDTAYSASLASLFGDITSNVIAEDPSNLSLSILLRPLLRQGASESPFVISMVMQSIGEIVLKAPLPLLKPFIAPIVERMCDISLKYNRTECTPLVSNVLSLLSLTVTREPAGCLYLNLPRRLCDTALQFIHHRKWAVRNDAYELLVQLARGSILDAVLAKSLLPVLEDSKFDRIAAVRATIKDATHELIAFLQRVGENDTKKLSNASRPKTAKHRTPLPLKGSKEAAARSKDMNFLLSNLQSEVDVKLGTLSSQERPSSNFTHSIPFLLDEQHAKNLRDPNTESIDNPLSEAFVDPDSRIPDPLGNTSATHIGVNYPAPLRTLHGSAAEQSEGTLSSPEYTTQPHAVLRPRSAKSDKPQEHFSNPSARADSCSQNRLDTHTDTSSTEEIMEEESAILLRHFRTNDRNTFRRAKSPQLTHAAVITASPLEYKTPEESYIILGNLRVCNQDEPCGPDDIDRTASLVAAARTYLTQPAGLEVEAQPRSFFRADDGQHASAIDIGLSSTVEPHSAWAIAPLDKAGDLSLSDSLPLKAQPCSRSEVATQESITTTPEAVTLQSPSPYMPSIEASNMPSRHADPNTAKVSSQKVAHTVKNTAKGKRSLQSLSVDSRVEELKNALTKTSAIFQSRLEALEIGLGAALPYSGKTDTAKLQTVHGILSRTNTIVGNSGIIIPKDDSAPAQPCGDKRSRSFSPLRHQADTVSSAAADVAGSGSSGCQASLPNFAEAPSDNYFQRRTAQELDFAVDPYAAFARGDLPGETSAFIAAQSMIDCNNYAGAYGLLLHADPQGEFSEERRCADLLCLMSKTGPCFLQIPQHDHAQLLDLIADNLLQGINFDILLPWLSCIVVDRIQPSPQQALRLINGIRLNTWPGHAAWRQAGKVIAYLIQLCQIAPQRTMRL